MPDYDKMTKKELVGVLEGTLTKEQLRSLVSWYVENDMPIGGPAGGEAGSQAATNIPSWDIGSQQENS